MIPLQKLASAKGLSVLVRVDYNVPLKNGKVTDTRRIESSYETIDTILKKGAIPLLLAHLGDKDESLQPVATVLSKKYKVVFITNDLFDTRTHEIISTVPSGTVILFENIRRYTQEEESDAGFAALLASYGDIYVNDAFSVSHRKHASVVGVPKLLPSYAGLQLQKEIKVLTAVVETPAHPFLFILGGAKFSTKIPLLKKFSETADSIVIGGAILNNFYKVLGFTVGDSVVEAGYDAAIKALLKNPKLLLPVDVVVSRSISGKNKKLIITPNEVQKGDVIVDIGTQSIELISQKIQKAKLIVWNGPMGWYEKGYTVGTTTLAQAVTVSKAKSIIGGGDTGAAIESVVDTTKNKKLFISTGGGATLEFLAKGTLPGIRALK